eukprot:1319493-Alexandrium_andersonii.AAC.1
MVPAHTKAQFIMAIISARAFYNAIAWARVTSTAVGRAISPVLAAYRAVAKVELGFHAITLGATALAAQLLLPHPRVIFAVSRLRSLAHLAKSPA